MAEPVQAPESMLSVRNVSFAYGHLQVLYGVDLEIPAGGRVCLLGTNGAGKSTLLNLIAGLDKPTHGSVWFEGHDITGVRADERVGLGITQVAGGRAIFPTTSVYENLKVGTYPFRRDRRLATERIDEVLDLFPRLRERAGQKAGTLSGGEQQMVAVARALIARPKLLLADELSLGLAPVLVLEVMRMVEEIVRRGTTLLLVEQSLSTAFAMTEQAHFMERGEIRFSGSTEELAERDDLIRAVFLGGDRRDAATVSGTRS